jgi:DNA-directed RNA polymerase sigma subunit (sigma70/sigma32)
VNSSLSPRHHAGIIDDDVYKSLAEMGRIYHLSETRAKRTEDEAIGKLRKKMKHAP